MTNHFWLVLACSLACAAPCVAREEPLPSVDLQWSTKMPMRDGIKLNATIYRPHAVAARLPMIFTLTPYIGDSYHARAMYFAQHGYGFALVDVRGRGSSEGAFDPMAQEARDGHDVVEWLAAQPWCDGNVAMWGGSYAGYDQWATARELPPHLKTIVPAAAAFPGVDFPFFKNISFPYLIQWMTYTSGATGNANLFNDTPFWIAKFRELYLGHVAFAQLPILVGNTTTRFSEWLAHPEQGEYWDAMAPSAEQFARIDLPILTITGHYDDDQPGALEHYKRHLRHATPAARAKHYLVIGPWDHAGTRTPQKQVGGLTFGDQSLLDLNDLHRQWYDWTLKRGSKPAFLQQHVAYYVVGRDQWKYAESLDGVAGEQRVYYLAANAGTATSVFGAGQLATDAPPSASAPDHFVYDPLDIRPAAFATSDSDNDNALVDQRQVLALDGTGLVYHSAPFTEDTLVSGEMKLTLWLELDVPDTDIAVVVYELLGDGSHVLLAHDQVRARYRQSLREAKLVTPGTVNRYEFAAFNFFSRCVAKGSRLRLLVTCPNSVFAQKNYNSGGVVAKESKADAHTAHVALYHDAAHPSALELPFAR